MKKTAVITGFIGAVALIAPFSLFADEAEDAAPPPLTDVWMVIPKTGMESQFVAAAEADKVFRKEAGDTRNWSVFTVEIGHHYDVIQFRGCCFSWADQDTYEADDLEKGFADNWNENVDQYVDHYHRYFEYTDWANSNWAEGENDGPYYGVTTWTVKHGAGPASSAARKKLSQVAINEGWEDQWLWLSRIGGRRQIAIVSSYEKYADMAPPEQSLFEFMTEQLGAEEAAAMFADFDSGFTDSDYTVWKFHPGMSDDPDDD
jgi:hypothetical protein